MQQEFEQIVVKQWNRSLTERGQGEFLSPIYETTL
jgi:hypothetical protein